MSTIRVQIDLNAERADGLTMAPIADVSGSEPKAGKIVRVFEPEDGVEGIGMLEKIDNSSGYVYVRVNWDTIHDVEQVAPFELLTKGALETVQVLRSELNTAWNAWGALKGAKEVSTPGDRTVGVEARILSCA